jgi:hypothetical protein
LSATCPLHQVPLIPGECSAVYGLWSPGREYDDARERLFPNSHLQAPQGCFYSADFPKRVPVMFCPQCRAAELEWKPFSETF